MGGFFQLFSNFAPAMRKILLLLLLVSVQTLAAKNDSIPQTEVTFKFGGRIDVEMYYDSYKNIESRNGLQYNFPDKPNYNPAGEDINFQPRLRFGVAPTRLNLAVNATNVMGADVKGYVEIDFMGVADNVLSSLRMRHAYVNMQWKSRSLLFGQTSHLTMVDEISANTVTFGGGFSIHPLNRPVQVQFRQNFGKASNVTLAAAIFGGVFGDQQSYALMPDIQLRVMLGDPAGFMYGAVGGVKSIKPRLLTATESLTDKKVVTFDAAVFARYTFAGGYAVRLYGLWGQDLTPLSIIGGYAPLYSERDMDDYGYAPISAVSAFLDFDSKQYSSGLQWGIFGGWQHNLGSTKEIDLERAAIPNSGINTHWRVAPRVYYNYKKFLTFGLEYMLSCAVWGQEMDLYYKPITTYKPTYNNRITFLTRFKF